MFTKLHAIRVHIVKLAHAEHPLMVAYAAAETFERHGLVVYISAGLLATGLAALAVEIFREAFEAISA